VGASSWHELTAAVLRTPLPRLGLATVLTALNYVALTGYDLLAFAYIRHPLPRKRILLASFLAFAISNNVGLAMLSGASVRYRFYTRWGVTREELSRIVFSYAVTFWLGLLALGGLSLVMMPLPDTSEFPVHELLRPIGCLLMFLPAGYLLATVFRRTPLRVRR
jgi:phosphatidylglycerol lysyltransferase